MMQDRIVKGSNSFFEYPLINLLPVGGERIKG
jgi:hypothetical protein